MSQDIEIKTSVPVTVTAKRGNVLGDAVAEMPPPMQERWAAATARDVVNGSLDGLGDYVTVTLDE